MNTRRVLIVDDELGIRNLLSEILSDAGYDVYTAEDAAQARAKVATERFDLILLDIWMPDTDGVTLLKEWEITHAINCPVVMMSGHGTIETAVEATRYGAVDFLEKPIALKRLLETCARVLKQWEDLSIQHNGTPPIPAALAEEAQEYNQRKKIAEAENSQDAASICTRIDGPDTGDVRSLPAYEIQALGLLLDFNRPLRELRDDFERAYLTRVLRYKGGSISQLAKHAQIERTHLYRKFKQLGIDPATLTGADNRDTPLPVYGKDNLPANSDS